MEFAFAFMITISSKRHFANNQHVTICSELIKMKSMKKVRELASNQSQHAMGGDHLVGLVVKASASRTEDPGFESRLRRDFFGVKSYQ